MKRSTDRPVARCLAAVVTLLSAWSCWVGDSALVPDQRLARLTLLPISSGPSAVGVADVQEGEIVVSRSDGRVAYADTFVVSSDTVSLAVEVGYTPPSEVFIIGILLRDSDGDVVFMGGPVDVTVGDDVGGDPIDVVLTYVGTGSDAASVTVDPPSATTSVGESLTFTAQGLRPDGSGTSGTPIK